ncbi:MAG: HEAT repeat domain-containing protein, partial [Deltaproteobacteria bacterium]|nr:HEAT repeat domain-containing protein [Deltaproteobacteria bacterium]
ARIGAGVTMNETALADLARAASSSEEDERYRAVVAAARLGWRETLEIAGPALGDDAWRVRKAAVAAVAQWAPDDEAWRLVRTGLGDGDNAGRRIAALELIERLGERLMPRVIELTEDPLPQLRKLALDAVLARPTADAVPALLRRLEDSDANVRGVAVEALSRIRDQRALAALVHVIGDRPARDPLERLAALRGLDALGAVVERAVLEPLLADPLLRNAALRLLARCPGLDVVILLCGAIDRTMPSTTAAAVIGLWEIGERDAAARRLIGERLRQRLAHVQPALLDAYVSNAEGMAQAVATLAAWIGAPALCGELFVGRRGRWLDPELRDALERCGIAGAAAVAERLRDMDLDDQQVALDAIAEVASQTTSAPVARLLKTAGGRVAVAAARCLGRCGGSVAIGAWIGRLADSDGEIAAACQQALQGLATAPGQDSARENWAATLRAGLQPLLAEEPISAAGQRALAVWPAVASRVDEPVLRRLLLHKDASVRALAIRALGAIDLPASDLAQQLRIALADEAAEVRLAAIESLARAEIPDAFEVVQRALGDSAPAVRAAVLERLALLAPERARTQLALAIVADPTEAQAAVLGCRHLAIEARGDLLQRAAASPHAEVLLAVARLLPDLEPAEILPLFDALLRAIPFEVRHAATSSYSTVCQRWPELRPQLQARLAALLEDERDGFVREAALAALAADGAT